MTANRGNSGDNSSITGIRDKILGWPLATVVAWLADRLSGTDPYFPLDKRIDEDPTALLVALLEEFGRADDIFARMSTAIVELLKDVKPTDARPAWMDGFLWFSRKETFAYAGPWFEATLEAVSSDPGSAYRTRDFLFAAIRQCPVRSIPSTRDSWERLLRVTDFSTIALHALATTFQETIELLPTWWERCRSDQRDMELFQMVRTWVRTHGDEVVSRDLTEAKPALKGMWQAIQEAARSNGLELEETDSGRYSSIDRAGVMRARVELSDLVQI